MRGKIKQGFSLKLVGASCLGFDSGSSGCPDLSVLQLPGPEKD